MSISVSVSVRVTGDVVPPVYTGSIEVAQSGVGGGNPGLVDVGTTEETLAFGDIAPGLVLLQNLDDTNVVEWGFATTVRPGRLLPNKPPTLIYVSSATIFVKADTAACKVRVLGYQT